MQLNFEKHYVVAVVVFMLTILFCKNMLECMQTCIQVSQALMCRHLGFSVPPEIGALLSVPLDLWILSVPGPGVARYRWSPKIRGCVCV